MTPFGLAGFESLIAAASPAVLTTYRQSGEAQSSPVWFRATDEAFEVVIAIGDVKLAHLRRDPRVVLVIFEASAPFRGIELRCDGVLREGDVYEERLAISSRYLGAAAGERFTAARAMRPGMLLRMVPGQLRTWDLRAILPG
jgi:hypothetical protein